MTKPLEKQTVAQLRKATTKKKARGFTRRYLTAIPSLLPPTVLLRVRKDALRIPMYINNIIYIRVGQRTCCIRAACLGLYTVLLNLTEPY